MKIIKTTYAKELNKASEKQYNELGNLISDTQDIITRLEGKNGEPVISITTKSKNFTLSIKQNG